MIIISYYVDKYGRLFQIIRTENSVKISRVIDDIPIETDIIIEELIETIC
jgi:hypothetical protein